MENTLSLNGSWELFGFPQRTSPVKSPAGLAGREALPAEVPGEAQLALSKAGILPADLYMGLNMMKLREYEFYEWWYRKKFTAAPDENRAVLVFEGVDCVAEYYLNGERFGTSNNALIAHEFDVTALLREGENELVIRLASPIEEAVKLADTLPAVSRSHHGCMEHLRLRRAPSSHGWDIMCRCVTCGLWRGVRLEMRGPHRVAQMYVSTRSVDRETGRARLRLFHVFETDALHAGLRYQLEGFLGDALAFTFGKELWFVAGGEEFDIEDARLWWPAGYGEQPLYRLRLSLWRGDELLCERWDTLGIRTLKLERTVVTTKEKPGKFCFHVNGEPIMCKGSNWVPLDAFHSRDPGRYEKAVGMLHELGCNIVRCWGGNIYEDHKFYDLCDQYGILVWQDFTMACNLYPRDEAFFSQMRVEARAVIQKLRQHPSIALWSGDNECDYYYNAPGLNDPNRNIVTREVLRLEAENHDGERDYLPSSPYRGPEWAAGLGDASEEHLWGPRVYYKEKFYTDSRAHFVSETGFHGCPNRESIERFITPENVWPDDPKPWFDNREWFLHASSFPAVKDGTWAGRNTMMAKQIAEVFGGIPDDLDAFILASQLVQAEAFKFFIETARLRKWDRTGIIWWNLLDGWPQFSDAIVDWYWGKKLAYYWIKQAQKPLHLMFAEPESWCIALSAGNDSLEAREGSYRVKDAFTGEVLLEGAFKAPANGSRALGRVPVCCGEWRLFLIEWESGGETGQSHYLHGKPGLADVPRLAEVLKGIYLG